MIEYNMIVSCTAQRILHVALVGSGEYQSVSMFALGTQPQGLGDRLGLGSIPSTKPVHMRAMLIRCCPHLNGAQDARTTKAQSTDTVLN